MKGSVLADSSAVFPHGLCGVVFDVDGVLFDSEQSNTAYYNLIREAVGLPSLSPEESAYCHMASVGEAFTRIIPAHLVDAAAKAAKDINYGERILPMLKPEPGLLETLHWLKQWDIRMAVCTNRTNSVEALLRYFGLEQFFWPVRTAGNGEPKPSPMGLNAIVADWKTTPGQIIFIGDSKVDEQASVSAGVPFASFRNQELSSAVLFNDFFEVIAWLTPLVEHK